MLKGIDVSSHNGWPFSVNTEKYYMDSDFVIVKATQGTSYLYKDYRNVAERAIADGKLIGFYHYANGNDPLKEAEYFYNAISDYLGRAVMCLDFEHEQNSAYNDLTWAYRFVNRFHVLANTWPLVYVSAAARSKVSNCAKTCGLWVAGYPRIGYASWALPRFAYSVDPWPMYTIWQYTNGPNGTCDLNAANLDRDGWLRIARGDGAKATAPGIDAGNIWATARAVINGAYGNGDVRRASLGSVYESVQSRVNMLVNSTDEELAKHVIAGEMGNGELRKQILGSRYEKVQNVVNSIL